MGLIDELKSCINLAVGSDSFFFYNLATQKLQMQQMQVTNLRGIKIISGGHHFHFQNLFIMN